jgi:REP element-mobilizing transposase RayT
LIPKVVNAIKGLASKQIGFSIWQRSFHDHIIRDEYDYIRIAEYIENNPTKWEQDCFYGGKI